MIKLNRIQLCRFSFIKDKIKLYFPKGLSDLPVLYKEDTSKAVRKLNPKHKDDFYAESVAKDKAMIYESEMALSEFEKLKLKELDNIFGTNTYYHEVKPNEMRLDSEHVMSIKMLEKLSENPLEKDYERYMTYDPQSSENFHKVRNPSELLLFLEPKLSTLLFNSEKLPMLIPETEGIIIENTENSGDKFSFLEKYKDDERVRELFAKFTREETFYSLFTTFKSSYIEICLRDEAFESNSGFNLFPIITDKVLSVY